MFFISSCPRYSNTIKTFFVLVSIFILVQTSFAQNKSVKQNPQLKKAFELLSGKWHFKNGSHIGTEFWHCGLNCTSIVEDYYSVSPVKDTSRGMGIIWWDSSENYFKVTWCTNKDTAGCILSKPGSKWISDSLILFFPGTIDGKEITYKEIFSDFTKSSFSQSLFMMDQGKQKLIFKYTCYKE